MSGKCTSANAPSTNATARETAAASEAEPQPTSTAPESAPGIGSQGALECGTPQSHAHTERDAETATSSAQSYEDQRPPRSLDDLTASRPASSESKAEQAVADDPGYSPTLSAADWHADGASIVFRYFYETWCLHNAAVEARYAPLGLFRNNPDAFPGGRKRWSETFDQFFSVVKAYKPPLFFEEWPRARAVIEEWRASATLESLANGSFQQSLAERLAEEWNSILRDDRALAEAFKVLAPSHLRKICEHARERLITIGQYERENIQAAKTGAPGFPVLSGRYCPRGLLTVIWALADRVGKGWPEVPLHEFYADEAFRLLGGLIRWCDQRQAELDGATALLGVWRSNIALMPTPAAIDLEESRRRGKAGDAAPGGSPGDVGTTACSTMNFESQSQLGEATASENGNCSPSHDAIAIESDCPSNAPAKGSEGSTRPDDPITKRQAAAIVSITVGAMGNAMSEKQAPPAAVETAGSPKVWSFAVLAPWLRDRWPGMAYRMETYEEAKKLFDDNEVVQQ